MLKGPASSGTSYLGNQETSCSKDQLFRQPFEGQIGQFLLAYAVTSYRVLQTWIKLKGRFLVYRTGAKAGLSATRNPVSRSGLSSLQSSSTSGLVTSCSLPEIELLTMEYY